MDLSLPRVMKSVKENPDLELITQTDGCSNQVFKIYVARNGIIIGGNFPVCVIDKNSHFDVILETSDYLPWTALWSKDGFARSGNSLCVDELGEACCLSLPHNFCHWHQEALPKVCILEKMGYQGSYVIASAAPLFTESLKLIGIKSSRIYPLGEGNLRVKRLYIPQPLPLALGSFFPMALWDARERCLAGREDTITAKRLFIARSQNTHRHIVKEDDFMEALVKYNFIKVLMEDYSLPQQIGLAYSADTIMGPHGAGMSNSLFMRQNGLVVEMFSPAYINSCIIPICKILDLDYFSSVSRVNPVHGYQEGENIVPDMQTLCFILDKYLN